jgi:DNA-binding LacI/PurR family transcriptional regulator
VSAVLNDSSPVSAELRLRVMDAVEALGYRPTRGASAAAGRGGRSIGVLVKELDNPYFAGVIAGVRAHADSHGYALLVASSERDPEVERRTVALLADGLSAGDVAGLIVTPVLGRRRRPHPPLRAAAPAGAVRPARRHPRRPGEPRRGRQPHGGACCRRAPGGTRAHPHRPLRRARREHAGRRARRRAAPRVQRRAGAVRDDDIVPAGAHLEDGYRAALAYFRAVPPEQRPTAVTCFNDLVAVGVCRALAECQLRVPDDVSVVGYDDIPLLEYLSVPLTSVRVPTREMGRMAAELLLRHVEGGASLPTQKIYLDAELVVRRSTAAPAAR